MVAECHLCESKVSLNGAAGDELKEGFECHDCGNVTCDDCKSLGVARSSEHCVRCRG